MSETWTGHKHSSLTIPSHINFPRKGSFLSTSAVTALIYSTTISQWKYGLLLMASWGTLGCQHHGKPKLGI